MFETTLKKISRLLYPKIDKAPDKTFKLLEGAGLCQKVQHLKTISGYWPSITRTEENGHVFLTTLVRVNLNGAWSFVHCAEWCIVHGSTDEDAVKTISRLYEILAISVHRIQNCYVPCQGFSEVDVMQVSEEERVKTYYTC